MAFSAIGAIFSPKSDYFAYASLDGCLKIWETSSNNLKQEYTPSSHLSSTCSALTWGPCQQRKNSGAKKMKKDRFSTAIADLNLIAMGTLSGEIILYSVTDGALHKKLSGGHTDSVNDVSWFPEEDSLFSCSTDQHVIRWSILTGNIITKWKAGKSSVHAVCVIDDKNILTASSTIIWWDLKTQNIIKKFIGHAAEVFCLIPVGHTLGNSKCKYFLSSAVGDRVINVWQLNEESDDSSIASFTLPDEPATLDISNNVADTQCLVVSAVTKNGTLSVFEHQLNGRVKRPLMPKINVQMGSMATQHLKSQPIPILAAKLSQDGDKCVVSYGNFLKPVFEKIALEDLNGDTFLIRQNHCNSAVEIEGLTKIKQPNRPNNVKVLAPGYMVPTKPTENTRKKKKRKADRNIEIPMEEKLNALYLGQAPESTDVHVTTSTPSSDSLVHLLLQGLQSGDKDLLSTVLRNSDESLIRNTIKRLPLHTIPQLLTVLHERLTRKEQQNRPCLRWLKILLGVHLSYLTSLQEIDDYVGPVSQLIDAREEMFPKMSQLKGFLDILWSQIDSRTESSESSINTKPLAVYEDESSNEEMEEQDETDDEDAEHLKSHLDVSESEDSEDRFPLDITSDEMEDS